MNYADSEAYYWFCHFRLKDRLVNLCRWLEKWLKVTPREGLAKLDKSYVCEYLDKLVEMAMDRERGTMECKFQLHIEFSAVETLKNWEREIKKEKDKCK